MCAAHAALGQAPPSAKERAEYTGPLAAAARGDAAQIKALTAKRDNVEIRDGHGPTPLHVAAYGGHHEAMRVLVAAGANPNALENDRYDIVTIAAVANDLPTLKLALALGDGGLRHSETLKALIDAGANVNLADRNGQTPLVLARGRGYGTMVTLLLQAGAR